MSNIPVPVARPQKLFLLEWTPEGHRKWGCALHDVTISQVVRTTNESNARLIAYGRDECTEHPDWWNNAEWVSCTCIGSALGGEPDTVVIQDFRTG